MNSLFDIPPVEKSESTLPFPGKHCRDCKHIANLNPYSTRYWYCTITPCKRTPYGVKSVKRMDNACSRLENK